MNAKLSRFDSVAGKERLLAVTNLLIGNILFRGIGVYETAGGELDVAVPRILPVYGDPQGPVMLSPGVRSFIKRQALAVYKQSLAGVS